MCVASAGDAAGNIRVWDLTAGACSCELVPEVGTPVRCALNVNPGNDRVATADWQLVASSKYVPLSWCRTGGRHLLLRADARGGHACDVRHFRHSL